MGVPLTLLLLAVLLPLQALAQPLGLLECRSLRGRRDRLASEAMQAEIALVIATRMALCPQLERLAERANAGAGATASPSRSPAAETTARPTAAAQAGEHGIAAPDGDGEPAASQEAPLLMPVDFDYTAYLECRRRAETQLQRGRPVLYSNRRGFSFYTSSGARLARQADALQQQLDAGCGASPAGA